MVEANYEREIYTAMKTRAVCETFSEPTSLRCEATVESKVPRAHLIYDTCDTSFPLSILPHGARAAKLVAIRHHDRSYMSPRQEKHRDS